MRISDWSSDVCSSDLLYCRPDALGRDPRKSQGRARRQIRPARFPRHRLVGGRDADRGARGRDRPLGGGTNRLTPAGPAPSRHSTTHLAHPSPPSPPHHPPPPPHQPPLSPHTSVLPTSLLH